MPPSLPGAQWDALVYRVAWGPASWTASSSTPRALGILSRGCDNNLAFLKDHFGFNVKNDLERGKQECRLQRYSGGKTNSTWKLSGYRRDR